MAIDSHIYYEAYKQIFHKAGDNSRWLKDRFSANKILSIKYQ